MDRGTGEGDGCDPSDSPSALAWPLEPLGGLAMGSTARGEGGPARDCPRYARKGFNLIKPFL